MILFFNLYKYLPEETRVIFEPKIRNMPWMIPFSNHFILMLKPVFVFKYEELIWPDFYNPWAFLEIPVTLTSTVMDFSVFVLKSSTLG